MSPARIEPKEQLPEWFSTYLQRGFRLIKYAHGQKGPSGQDAVNWPKKAITSPDRYVPDSNWGALLGVEVEPGKCLVDIDFDLPEGLPLAKRLLPSTSFAFGRGERKVTHAFYTSPKPLASKRFETIEGKCLVELRCAKKNGTLGLQTMLPPSVHPSGELIELRLDGDITHCEDIGRRVALYAVGCYLLFALGHRGLTHDVRLALAGFLLQEGVEESDVISLGQAIADVTGNDVNDVLLTVQTTATKLHANEPVTGKTKLEEALGQHGKAILDRIREWLGVGEFIEDRGRVVSNQENISRALHRLGVTLSYDLFSEQEVVSYNGYQGTLDEFRNNEIWLEIERRFHFRPPKDYFDTVLAKLAFDNRFNPVANYLNSLTWDKKPRLETWLIDYGKAKDSPYTRAVGSLPLMAAVRRVRDTSGLGVKFDELLVLESGQGLNKSRVLRALCPNEDWFSDDLPLDVDAKQIIERTVGKLVIEAAELAGMRQSQVESLKAMLSRQKDGPVRMAYARKSITRPRQFVVIGTTNTDKYLKDSTGNRRFWPIKVERFDVEGLRAIRDQLWAEAAHREALGESIRLDPALYDQASKQQEHRREEDPWEVRLADRFPKGKAWRLRWDEIYEAVGLSIDRRDERAHRRLVKSLQRLGFQSMPVIVRDDQGRDTRKRERGMGREAEQGDLPLDADVTGVTETLSQ